MGKRRQNPRRAKSLINYTIAESAELYGVHRNTVRLWLKGGLRPIDAGRPVLIHGSALNEFHQSRRSSGKIKCDDDQLYCLGCRAARRPALDVADYKQLSEKVGTLSAICPTCERVMTQRTNAARLARFSLKIAVSVRPAPEPISMSR